MTIRLIPFSVLVRVTVAPGMTAPVESLTVPEMVPVVTWAKAVTLNAKPYTNAFIQNSTLSIGEFPPPIARPIERDNKFPFTFENVNERAEALRPGGAI